MLTLGVCVIAFVGAALLAGIGNWLELWRWRASAGLHWSERARRLYPARVAAYLNAFVVAAMVVAYEHLAFRAVSWTWPAPFALFGGLCASYLVQRAVYPDLTWRTWIPDALARLVIHSTTLVIVGVAALLMPSDYSWRTWAVAVGYVVGLLTLQFGVGLRILQALGRLQCAGARSAGLVSELATAMNIPVRRIWEWRTPAANAHAFITVGDVAFTSKLLAVCSDDELRAVCAHELGHLTEPRRMVVARVVGTLIVFFPAIFYRPALVHGGSVGSLIIAIAMFIAMIGRNWLTRKLEVRADRAAHTALADPTFFARALERIHMANQFPTVLRKRRAGTHPELYDRLLAAGMTPDFPRPKPPPAILWSPVILLAVFVGSALVKHFVFDS